MKSTGSFFYVSAIDRLLDSSINQVGLALYKQANREECLKSILKNLSNILNTRSQTPAELYDAGDLTVIDFGIPDLSHYSPENIDDRIILLKRLKKAVTVFEPRLKDISIEFNDDMPDEKTLVFIIRAYLNLDTYPYEVSFLSKKQFTEGNWEVYESAG